MHKESFFRLSFKIESLRHMKKIEEIGDFLFPHPRRTQTNSIVFRSDNLFVNDGFIA